MRPGKSNCPPPGSSAPVAAVSTFQSSPFTPARSAPRAITVLTSSRDSAWTTSAEPRGSVSPFVTCTRAPAARAVAIPATDSGLPVASTRVPLSGWDRGTSGASPRRPVPAGARARAPRPPRAVAGGGRRLRVARLERGELPRVERGDCPRFLARRDRLPGPEVQPRGRLDGARLGGDPHDHRRVRRVRRPPLLRGGRDAPDSERRAG